MSRLLLALSLSLGCAAASAATITVTRFDDPDPMDCAVDGCTLREAATAAGLTPEADTIVLAAGEYVLEPPYAATAAPLALPTDVTLLGAGMNSTAIRGNGIGSLLLMSGGKYTLRRLTVKDGYADGSIYISTFGGAIRGYQADITLDQVALRDNHASQGGAMWLQECTLSLRYTTIAGNDSGFGAGGMQLLDTPATIYRSIIQDNIGQVGGGIRAQNSPLRLQGGSRLLRNHAEHSGGAVASNSDFLADDDSLVADNTASSGGAFVDIGKGLVVKGVKTTNGTGLLLLSNNDSDNAYGSFGGAMFISQGLLMERVELIGSDSTHSAGAIYSIEASVVIRDSRIADSHTLVNGGAAFFANSSVLLERVAFENNVSDGYAGAVNFSGAGKSIELKNVDFYNNRAPAQAAITNSASLTMRHVTFWSNMSNTGRDAVHQGSTGSSNYANSVVLGRCTGTPALISALGSNLRSGESSFACAGGFSLWSASLSRGTFGGLFPITGTTSSTSSIVNAGNAAYCQSTDIRNRARDVKCDLGAFEYGAL